MIRKPNRRAAVAALMLALMTDGADASAPPIIEAPQWLVAEALPCTVLRAVDGDTLALACPGGPVTVRLEGIDAPELRGACPAERTLARLARDTVAGLAGTPALLWFAYQDRWGRTVGHVSLGPDGALGDLGQALVAAALAQDWPHDAQGRALGPRPAWCLTAPMPTPRPGGAP